MAESYASSGDPFIARQRPHCPKCDAMMHLVNVARGPSWVDVSTFDCPECDHTRIVTAATDLATDSHSLHARAMDALEAARAMSPGAQRNDALKKAGLLRRTADDQGLVSAKRGTSRK